MRKLLIALVILAIAGGAVALVLTNRPPLDDARNAVDAAWQPLVPPLTDRYARLGALEGAVAATPAANAIDEAKLEVYTATMARWNRAVATKDPSVGVVAANDLETRIGQLRGLIPVSAHLSQSPAVLNAFVAFNQAPPPPQLVTAYNDAVRKYQRARESVLRRVVVDTFGYDERASFEPSGATQ